MRLPPAVDTALLAAPFLPEVTVGVVTPPDLLAVTILLLVMAVAMSRPRLPATVSALQQPVVVVVVVEEGVNHTTVVVVGAATGPLHPGAHCPLPTNTLPPAVEVVDMADVTTTLRPDVATRMIHTLGPTEVALAAGGITMNPIEGVR